MVMSDQVEAIIFDMDGVLYHLDLALRLKLFEEYTGIDGSIIDNNIWQSKFESQAEQGFYTSGESYLKTFNKILGSNISSNSWFEIRANSMTPIEGMLDLCRSLKKHHTIALLTNNSMLVKDGLIEKIIAPELSNIFKENLYTSAELKSRKPDPDVYLNICNHLKILPHRTLMIDDKKENILGAEQAGLKGHHYQNTPGLIHDLRSQNISF